MATSRNKYSASVNATKAEVSAVPVTIRSITLLNNVAAPGYLQMFFQPASGVTVGTTVADFVVPLPTSGGVSITLPGGWYLGGSGLTIAGTTTRTGNTNNAIDVAIMMD